MKYRLFDTHAHYDHPLFEGEGPHILEGLFKSEIDGVVIPATSYESNYNRTMFPEEIFKNVFFAAGIHPKFASFEDRIWSEKRTCEFNEILSDPRTVAVKTGLDFSNKKLTDEQISNQISYFEHMISCAVKYNLPLVLHVRDAVDEVIDVLRNRMINVEIVVHCYSYDLITAERLIDVGVTRFGIGGMLTRDGMDGLREAVCKLPISAILLETDSPFVRPKGYNEKYNTSTTLIEIAHLVAKLRGINIDEVVSEVQKNAKDFYRIQDYYD